MPDAQSPSIDIRTRLTERFGLRHPIVCAPMALVTGGELAAAVSRAGALGIVGGGYAGTLGGEPELEAELARAGLTPSPEGAAQGAARAAADNAAGAGKSAVGVGFIVWPLERAPHMLTVALRHSPRCVFLSFGDPRPFAREIHAAGAPLICQVQQIAQMDAALEAGATAIVAQGAEAGGHGGAQGASRSTMPFVPEAVDYVRRRSPETLVLAAGGIADGRGLAAALLLGADGVVVGSRFWSSAEALTPRAHTDKAAAVSGDATIRTRALDALRGVPWPREFSFRFLKNKFSDKWAAREDAAFAAFGTGAEQYAAARANHDLDTLAVVVGESVGLFHDRPPAAGIVEAMSSQAAALLRRAGGLNFT